MIDFFPMTKEHLPRVSAAEKAIFSDPWSEKSLEGHLASPYEKNFVALKDGEFCGYLVATVIAGEGEVLRIATLPSFRRHGVGKKLLALFLQETESAFLEVRSKNLPARSLYESLGFSVMGSRKNYYKDPTDDAVLYIYKSKEKTYENSCI